MSTPVGTSKGFENVVTGWGTSEDSFNVIREVEMSVESNSQYAGTFFGQSFNLCRDTEKLFVIL